MYGKKIIVAILLVSTFLISACVYIVLPEGLDETSNSNRGENLGWAGLVTNVGEAESGGLHIDLAIRNDTGDWSTMQAVENKPALLTTAEGETSDCEVVFAGTGGHRVAPGFQLRGYTSEADGEPVTQTLYVECADAAPASGSKLTIDYESFTGELDHYVEIEESNKVEGEMELNLDEVVTDLTYPVATPVEGLIQDSGLPITALSENVISLLDVQRSPEGFQFTWQNTNPSKFALKTHIGIPPVIGEDGIIYGEYVTMDMPDVPLTPAEGSVEWTTDVPVPEDVDGLYILLGVESKKPRTYLFYVLDITDQ